jgi:cytoskeletal protein CcmA (bactofilin family)
VKDIKKVDDNKLTGFLDEGAELDGSMKFRGSFRIDGSFKGKIDADAVLIIGPKGKVEAELNVSHVVINGAFTGNIRASEKVEINREGRVSGLIIAPKLVVEEGAVIDAQCQTSGEEGRNVREGAERK